jgi:hypothetical protein
LIQQSATVRPSASELWSRGPVVAGSRPPQDVTLVPATHRRRASPIELSAWAKESFRRTLHARRYPVRANGPRDWPPAQRISDKRHNHHHGRPERHAGLFEGSGHCGPCLPSLVQRTRKRPKTQPATNPMPGRIMQRNGHGNLGANAGDNIPTRNPMIPSDARQNMTSADGLLMPRFYLQR